MTNGNDSHWLSNPEQPLTGYARVIGDEATPRSLRTRLGLVMVQQRLAGSRRPAWQGLHPRPAGEGGARQPPVRRRAVARRAGRVLRARTRPSPGPAGPVDVSAACPVLAAWDRRDDLASPGAILFRRFVSRLLGNFQSVPTGVSCEPARGRERDLRRPLRPRRCRRHPERPEHGQPARRQGARRRGHRPRRAPASRSTGRCASSSPRPAAARRSRSTAAPGPWACSTRSTSPGTRRRAIRTSRTAPASSPRWRFKRKGCPAKALTFVTYGAVREPVLVATPPTTRRRSRASAGTGSRSAAARCAARRSSASASSAAEPTAR